MVDAGTRRLPLQRKIGAGLNASQFRRAVTDGAVKHFGLAESETIAGLTVRWPSGEQQTWNELPAGKLLRLVEGQVEGSVHMGLGYALSEDFPTYFGTNSFFDDCDP